MKKLPYTWRDFKYYIKHKHKELKLEDLIVRLRIEEDNRKSEKRSSKNSYEAKANVIEDSKGKASTSKGSRSKKARTCASREPTTSATKKGIRRMNVAAVSKRTRRTIYRQT